MGPSPPRLQREGEELPHPPSTTVTTATRRSASGRTWWSTAADATPADPAQCGPSRVRPDPAPLYRPRTNSLRQTEPAREGRAEGAEIIMINQTNFCCAGSGLTRTGRVFLVENVGNISAALPRFGPTSSVCTSRVSSHAGSAANSSLQRTAKTRTGHANVTPTEEIKS